MSSYHTINANQRRIADSFERQRNSEVARIATEYQKQGMTRTEALKLAEKSVPWR